MVYNYFDIYLRRPQKKLLLSSPHVNLIRDIILTFPTHIDTSCQVFGSSAVRQHSGHDILLIGHRKQRAVGSTVTIADESHLARHVGRALEPHAEGEFGEVVHCVGEVRNSHLGTDTAVEVTTVTTLGRAVIVDDYVV